MRTITALYDDLGTARAAVQDLLDNGFMRDNVSLVAADVSGEYARHINEPAYAAHDDVSAGEGAGFGALVGGVTGLLVGLGSLAIPGIGPVIAAGPLVAALTGASVGIAAGAVTGGLTAALIDMGVPETEADYYAEGVRQGGTLVSVTTDDAWAATATEILDRHNPARIEGGVTSQRQSTGTAATAGVNPYLSRMDEKESELENQPLRTGTNYSATQSAPTGAGTRETYAAPQGFDTYDPDFQVHYQTTYASFGPYSLYMPAYMYGYTLANDRRYYGTDWVTVEAEARREWESRDPDTPWEQIKDAARYAWDRVRGYR